MRYNTLPLHAPPTTPSVTTNKCPLCPAATSSFSPYIATSELVPGCRLQLLGDEFIRYAGGEGTLVADTEREGQYRVRLDSGLEKLIRLDCERFRLQRLSTPPKTFMTASSRTPEHTIDRWQNRIIYVCVCFDFDCTRPALTPLSNTNYTTFNLFWFSCQLATILLADATMIDTVLLLRRSTTIVQKARGGGRWWYVCVKKKHARRPPARALFLLLTPP